MKRYKKQKNRGARGFGFIAVHEGKIVEIERFELEGDMEKAIESRKESEILFHHRLPTSTPNHRDATHPIAVINDELEHNYYLAHNGVLRNEDKLRPIHEGLGYEYTTVIQEITTIKTKKGKKETVKEYFNDSESLAIEVARYLDGKSKKIDAIGTIAFICYETDKEDNILKIHYGRNAGNPLVVEHNGDLMFIKSEGDNKDLSVPVDTIHHIDYATGAETTTDIAVGRVTEYQTPANSGYRPYAGEASQKPAARIGFGAGRDDERTSQLSIMRVNDRVLEWGEDDLPFGSESGIPTIDYDDVDYDGAYAKYKKSEDHLFDIWTEIEALDTDIKKCEENLQKPSLSTEDTIYNEEYLVECKDVREEKRREARKLEDLLAASGR